MGKTLNHQIAYPDGGGTPNVPVAMQALAESADKAISSVSEAPFLVCHKQAAQSTLTGADVAVKWDQDVWVQGIGRPANDSSKVLIEQDGLYSVNARVAFTGGSLGGGNGTGAVYVMVNGVKLQQTWVDAITSQGLGPKPQTLVDLPLSAGDVVQIMAAGQPTAIPLIASESVFSIRKAAGYSA